MHARGTVAELPERGSTSRPRARCAGETCVRPRPVRVYYSVGAISMTSDSGLADLVGRYRRRLFAVALARGWRGGPARGRRGGRSRLLPPPGRERRTTGRPSRGRGALRRDSRPRSFRRGDSRRPHRRHRNPFRGEDHEEENAGRRGGGGRRRRRRSRPVRQRPGRGRDRGAGDPRHHAGRHAARLRAERRGEAPRARRQPRGPAGGDAPRSSGPRRRPSERSTRSSRRTSRPGC